MQKEIEGPGVSPSEIPLDRLSQQLMNPDRGIATRAVESISNLGVQAVPQIFEKIDAFTSKANANPSDSEIARKSNMAAADLIWSLVLIDDGSASVTLGKYADRSKGYERGVRKFAEWAIMRFNEGPTLEQASADANSGEFWRSMFGALDLDLLGTPETVEPLLKACDDMGENQQFLRGTAAWALRRHLDTKRVREKLGHMRDNDLDDGNRQIATEALKGPM